MPLPPKKRLRESDPQLRELWQRWSEGHKLETKELLMTAYIPLVQYIAGKRAATLPTRSILGVDDLTSEGMIGLSQAIETFNPARGVKFGTYASPRILGAMCDALREVDHLSRQMRKRIARGILRDITIDSLNRKQFTTDSQRAVPVGDLIADPASGDDLRAADARDSAQRLLRGIPEDLRTVLMLYDGEGMTMKEIGVCLGVSESRVSQMHAIALAAVRSKLEDPDTRRELE